MKIVAFPMLSFALLIGGTFTSHSQETYKKDVSAVVVDDDGPIIYTFEPDYLESVADRKEKIHRMRVLLDSLNISEDKRRKLLKDLYKNGVTDRLLNAIKSDSTLAKVNY